MTRAVRCRALIGNARYARFADSVNGIRGAGMVRAPLRHWCYVAPRISRGEG